MQVPADRVERSGFVEGFNLTESVGEVLLEAQRLDCSCQSFARAVADSH